MADAIEKKSIRLLDGNVRLYPRVSIYDIVKSVADNGDETLAVLVEATTTQNIVYCNIGTQPDYKPYSESAVADSFVVRTGTGRIKAADPNDSDDVVTLGYAKRTYVRHTNDNTFTGMNTFEEGIELGRLSQITTLTREGVTPGEALISWPEVSSADTFAVVSQVNTAKSEAISTAQSYTDSQINAKLSSALKYKGSIENYSDLPKTGQQIGDTWNVVNAYGNAHAGTNWAWNGTTWDPLGGTVDLTNYVTSANNIPTGNLIISASSSSRSISDSGYAPSNATLTDSATLIPTMNSVYKFVNSKISGSIWDSTKVLYGESNDSAAFGTASYILTSKKDNSGHLIAKESYLITQSVEEGGTSNIPSAAAVNIAVEGRVDKRTTSGNFVYTHTNATQSEIGYNDGAVASTIALRDAKGRLAAISAGYAFNVSTGSNIISVTGGNAASCTTGTELNALANAVNTISGNLKNLMISYEEVASA